MIRTVVGSLAACGLAVAVGAQDTSTADLGALIAKLGEPAHRDAAKEQLLGMGSEAVPALLAVWQTQPKSIDARRQALTVLRELGPQAGSAFPALAELTEKCTRSSDLFGQMQAVLAELALYRPRDAQERQREPDFTGGPVAVDAATTERLRVRFQFEPELNATALIPLLAEHHPFRRELAIERLGSMGGEARAALPHLEAILHQPDPRIATLHHQPLASLQRVPLRRAAAKAIVAIAPGSSAAGAARAVLDGTRAAPSDDDSAALPERARDRIRELVAELADLDTREDAIANLTAFGASAVRELLTHLPHDNPVVMEGLLTTFTRLGPQGKRGAVALMPLLGSQPASITPAVLEALAATAPWSRDLVPLVSMSTLGGTRIFFNSERDLGKPATEEQVKAIERALALWWDAKSVDPGAPMDRVVALLTHQRTGYRAHAIATLANRAHLAQPALDALVEAMTTAHPPRIRYSARGAMSQEETTPALQRAAAQAILAIASTKDPRAVKAREHLARHPR